MGMEIQVNSIEELCDLMCGRPEEDKKMSEYQITYKKKNDAYSEWFYYYVWCYKFDDAIGIFRDNFSKDEWDIVEVARIFHKDFSKY